MSIELHIERLVLDEAVLGGERAVAVRQAIERELRQWLGQSGTAAALARMGSVAALPAAMLPPARPHASSGLRIASAVQQSLDIHAGGGAKGHG